MAKKSKPALTKSQRAELKDRFWSWVESSINTYSNQIEALLDTLTDQQLTEFVTARAKDDDDADE